MCKRDTAVIPSSGREAEVPELLQAFPTMGSLVEVPKGQQIGVAVAQEDAPLFDLAPETPFFLHLYNL